MLVLSKFPVIPILWTELPVRWPLTSLPFSPLCSCLHPTPATNSHSSTLDFLILHTAVRGFLFKHKSNGSSTQNSITLPISLRVTSKVLTSVQVTWVLLNLWLITGHSSPLTSLYLHCPPCCSSNKSAIHLPQSLCTCCSLGLGQSFSRCLFGFLNSFVSDYISLYQRGLHWPPYLK